MGLQAWSSWNELGRLTWVCYSCQQLGYFHNDCTLIAGSYPCSLCFLLTALQANYNSACLRLNVCNDLAEAMKALDGKKMVSTTRKALLSEAGFEKVFQTQNWVRRSKQFCRWFCFLLGQAECMSVAAWTHWKLASYYFVASGIVSSALRSLFSPSDENTAETLGEEFKLAGSIWWGEATTL